MALTTTHRIIWLDTHIGKDGDYHSFKRMFSTTLDPDSQYSTELDALICALNANAVPFIFVDTIEKANHEIEINHDKKIIFISSGSLGERIIPTISQTYPHVYSFYIFCAVVENYIDFALDYQHCLQIFCSEFDLLVRLVRDISGEMIEQGKRHLIEHDPEGALDYFERSLTLETTANTRDTFNTPFFEHIRLLNGYRNETGLIEQAENMKKQQDEEREEQEAEPFLPDHDSQGQHEGVIYQNPDSPVAEQELMGENPDLPIAEEVALGEQQDEMGQHADLPIVEEILPVDQ